MIGRRLVALLTAVTMLHLSVVAGDAACASHGTGTRDEHAMSMDGDAMGAAMGVETSAVGAMPTSHADVPPCETPVQRHCCDALVGCSVASAVAGDRHGVDSTVVRAARISEALHDAPASFTSAPEPPPPKA
jgi:hypothetical protein